MGGWVGGEGLTFEVDDKDGREVLEGSASQSLDLGGAVGAVVFVVACQELACYIQGEGIFECLLVLDIHLFVLLGKKVGGWVGGWMKGSQLNHSTTHPLTLSIGKGSVRSLVWGHS